MTHPSRKGDMTHIYNWEQRTFEDQMWNWLHFALDNRNNTYYKTPQTERMGEVSGKTRPHFMTKHVLQRTKKINDGESIRNNSFGLTTKPSQRAQINTWVLFKDWRAAYKEHYRKERTDMKTHKVYVHYPEAVTEMHALFDFIDTKAS